mgnify:CR=1 FL=1
MPHLSGYEVTELLYANPDTVIQRAVRLRDQHPVILRRINNNYPTANQLSRFAYSYELLKRFDHPNIIEVVDWVETDKSPIMVLEDHGAIDLKSYRKTLPDQQLSIAQFFNIAIQLADALGEIHHQQIIHKDLHPGNILITPKTGKIQIIDFGLSSLLSREQPSLKPPEQLEGMLSYVSPEQTGRVNRVLDYRTDFYTLGLTFYELLTGKLPFSGEDALAIVHNHIARHQTQIVSLRPNVPLVVSHIIDKLLAKKAESRYQHALGLKHDFEKALQGWQQGHNDVFPLGEKDVSEQFRLPQRLYGRDKEIDNLLQLYQKAVTGYPQMLAVTGYSGIGKSSLIDEIHKPIAAQKGLFISGKFEQYLQNAPFAAIKQALRVWIRYALALNEQKLQAQQQLLHETLGSNCRVLVDFMPKMALILGSLPEVATLPPIETQTRFTRALCQFFQCISETQPLVLFIDDLQWADHGTLNLLQALMRESSGHFLLLVSYRDNELDSVHPTTIALNQIEQRQTLTLTPLDQAELEHLLSDTLFQPTKQVTPLAQLVHEKTGGNPFFINEFLKHLYQNDELNFDIHQRCWRWHMEQIRTQEASRNVIELLVQRIHQLPEKGQQLLQIASCLGSRFDLARLSIAADKTIADCATHLWPALNAGLIIQEGGDWHLEIAGAVNLNVLNLNQTKEALPPRCRFLHDKVLQAAYDDIEESTLEQTHLTIGRRLFEHYTEANHTRFLFGLIKHLNKGRKLIVSVDERLQLATLNEQAAQKTKQAGGWEDTARYAAIGQELLPRDSWKTHYKLNFSLHSVSAESAMLVGDHENAEMLYQTLMFHAQNELEKAQLCLHQLVLFLGQAKWDDALVIGQQGLRYCGFHLPSSDHEVSEVLPAITHKLALLMENTPIKEIISLSEMQNPRIRIAMMLISNIGTVCFIIAKTEYLTLYVQQALTLVYQKGKTDLAAMALAFYAFLKLKDEQYLEATELAEQALRVMESYPNCREAPAILNLVASVLHYKLPLAKARTYHQQGYHRSLSSGETLRGIANLGNELMLQVSQGLPLNEIEDRSQATLQLIQKKRTFYPIAILAFYFAKSLQGKQDNITDHIFNREILEKIKSCNHIAYLDHIRFSFSFWSVSTTEKLLCTLDKACSTISRHPGLSYNVDHNTLLSLFLIKAFTANEISIDHPKYSSLLESSLGKLQRLAEFFPNNFSHKYDLLQAEKYRLSGCAPLEAIPYYEKSIQSAKENGFLQYQALANELFGLFWLRRNNDVLAAGCLREALYLYEKWGCKVRIDYLLERHGALINTMEVNEALTRPSTQQVSLTSSRSTSQSSATQMLDLASIMKSARAISSEMNIDKLVTKVMAVIVENTGAQIGAIILDSPCGATLEAQLNMISGESGYLQGEPVEATQTLPISVIQTVLRSDEPVILHRGAENTPYQDDPYVLTHQPQSMLCVPIDHRDKLVGVLYLEHRELPQVFTEDRMELITLLQAQAAISLENARLFGELNHLNTELEAKVKERTAALQNAVEELHYLATRDSLTGIFNRRHFMDSAATELDVAQISNTPLAVMIIDIDHFKKVNDNYGHPQGDQVLIAVTKHCQSHLRKGDILGRIGGEEFGIMLPETTDEEALNWAQKLVDSIRQIEVATEKGVIKITLSAGACCLTFPCQTNLSEALENADQALYQAKNGGRNQVRLFDYRDD